MVFASVLVELHFNYKRTHSIREHILSENTFYQRTHSVLVELHFVSCSCCAYAGSIREHILSENTFYKRTHSVHMQALHFSAALQKCFFFFLYFLRIYGLCTSRQRRRNIFSITVLCFIFSIFFCAYIRALQFAAALQKCFFFV